MLHKDVLPVLGSEPLEAIKRADIGEIVHRIVERGAPIQANRTFEVIRGLYNWALGAGLVETTPCLGLKAPAQESSRERALSSEEVWRFWHGLSSAPMSWATAQILRLCLATAQRVSEVAGARRSEIDLADREWRLPGTRVKNRSAHVVPLCPLAMTLFEEALARSPDDDVVFPSPITKQAICGSSLAKAMKRSSQALQLNDATPHDLRRTAATGMAKCGVSRLVVDKVLNHVSADRSTIAGVYDRHAYQDEKRDALSKWEDYLLAIVERDECTENVVDLRAVG
jgi:integrase